LGRTRGERADVEQLAALLFELAGNPENVCKLTRAELVSRLAWSDRFRLRNLHEFPPPAFSYQPVRFSLEELVARLDSLAGGYIAVLGAPGSGKSTLETETLRNRSDRVVRYYAYVPDTIDPGRGEAAIFLHDIVVSLERAGFRAGESLLSADRLELADRFHRQLRLLHNDWEATGRKTIILIDGLDHIEREQNPERSLLRDLPPPEQVPDGVIILLGSQTEHLTDLSPSVELAIQASERRVMMRPLLADAVLQIVDHANLPLALSATQRTRIVALSDGHPLALHYILNRLRRAADPGAVDAILQDEGAYSGDIRNQYHAFWRRHVQVHTAFGHLLQLLAVFRSSIDLEWVERWADLGAIQALRGRAYHFFREDANRWYSHHNSFRQFLLERVRESAAGRPHTPRVAALHEQIAQQCRSHPHKPWRWEELYHSFHAGDHAAVVGLATQERFRQQFFDLRPAKAILADIELGVASATIIRDLPALAGLLFAHVECSGRASYMEEVPTASLLLQLGDPWGAVAHARDGNRLLIDRSEALALSRRLARSGYLEEGRRLFELAEPLDLLTSGGEVDWRPQHRRTGRLEEWATAAIFYRPLHEVIGTIRHLGFRDELGEPSDGQRKRELQNSLLFNVGLALVRAGRFEDIEAVLGELSEEERDREVRLWLRIRFVGAIDRSGDAERARRLLEDIITGEEPHSLGDVSRIELAEGAFRTLDDRSLAELLLDGIKDPSPADLSSARSDDDWRILIKIFRLARIRYLLGDRRPINEVFPDADEPRQRPAVLVMREVVRLGRIWARSWIGEETLLDRLMFEIRGSLRRFNIDRRPSSVRHDWHSALSLRGRFYELLVSTIAEHGPAALDAMCRSLDEEWAEPRTGSHWHLDLRRDVVVSAASEGASRSWALAHLVALEERLFDGLDAHGRVETCKSQIRAYLAVGEVSRARRVLESLIRTAHGVGYSKDHQFDTWLEWLDRASDLAPERLPERIDWHARAVVSLRESTEGGHHTASVKLLGIVARRDPHWTIDLMHWFHGHGVLLHGDALVTLLNAALRSDYPPVGIALALTAHVLVPYATCADKGLVRELVSALCQRGRSEAVGGGRTIVQNAERFALPSARNDWLEAVAGPLETNGIRRAEIGLGDPPASPADERDSQKNLVLRDGSRMTVDDAVARVRTADELVSLLENENVGEGIDGDISRFDWGLAVRAFAPKLDRFAVAAAAAAFRCRRRDSSALIELARRALALGDRDLAWSIAVDAAGHSQPQGWDWRYDGGSRLAAFALLVEIDRDRGRAAAWTAFRSDFNEENYYRSRFIYSLDRIAEILSPVVPVEEIYARIEDYVHSLFPGADFPVDGPGVPKEVARSDAHAPALLRLLEFHLRYPSQWAAQAGLRCLSQLLANGEPAAWDFMSDRLRGDEEGQEVAIQTLDALSLSIPDAVRPFEAQILGLVSSPHWATRRAVKEIATRLGWEIPQASPNITPPLSSVYQIELPPASRTPRPETMESEDGTRTFPEDATAFEIVYPQHIHLDAIAMEADLCRTNLYQRTVRLMQTLGLTGGWSGSGEAKLMGWLGELGPKFTYRRPRYTAVRRAIYHLVAELVDGCRLDAGSLEKLDSLLRYWDPGLLLRMPSKRWRIIAPLGGEDIYRKGWLERVEEVFDRLAVRDADGSVILAEETELVHPVWERYAEERVSLVCLGPVLREPRQGPIFSERTNLLIRDYAKSGVAGVSPPLVIRHDPFGFDSPCCNWLALNPFVGRMLGWSASPDGLFRWTDAGGALMVETIWWVDGPVAISPYHDIETGEGFLVLASARGWAALSEKLGCLGRITRARRTLTEDGTETESVQTRFKAVLDVS
jgi:hypothetical protein